MKLRIVLVLLVGWAQPTSALQCHHMNYTASGALISTTKSCTANEICEIYMIFNNTFDKIHYRHDCEEFCVRNEYVKLRMNIVGDPDQTCTYYIQDGIKKIYCECATNFCNDLRSPLQKLLRQMYEAFSDRDLQQVLNVAMPRDMPSANPSIETHDNVPIPLDANHERAKRAAVPILNCQKVSRKGDVMEISFESGKGSACGIRFQTTGDMKTVAIFEHQTFSYCINKAMIKKVYRLDGDPSQTCIHYVQSNRDSVYCECYTSNCNSINSPLHNLFKTVVKEAWGRDMSYFVNYPRLACDSANLSMVQQWPY